MNGAVTGVTGRAIRRKMWLTLWMALRMTAEPARPR